MRPSYLHVVPPSRPSRNSPADVIDATHSLRAPHRTCVALRAVAAEHRDARATGRFTRQGFPRHRDHSERHRRRDQGQQYARLRVVGESRPRVGRRRDSRVRLRDGICHQAVHVRRRDAAHRAGEGQARGADRHLSAWIARGVARRHGASAAQSHLRHSELHRRASVGHALGRGQEA